jgi:predicted ATPase/class 3 adenylate cyclase
MPERLTGTVTLLFTDIEGSTRLLQRLGDRYGDALAQHRRLLRDAIANHRGQEVDNQGDAIFAAFPTAREAVAAAVAAQRSLTRHQWPDELPVRVRMGIHTGEPTATGEGYVGIDLHRAARICAAAHGGQVLISQTTRDLVGDKLPPETVLRDLGEYRLKDLTEPQRLFQVVVAGMPSDFPPLRSLDHRPTNLPAQLTVFVGRERELVEVTGLLRQGALRLLTLTGPGGSGKTRLALQAANALVDEFRNGACLVPLAPVTDPLLVGPTIAQTLGVRQAGGQPLEERLRDELQDRELLLLLDNFEHLVAAAPLVAGLLLACPRLKVMITSREAVHLSGEQEYHVPPLPGRDAVALFAERARAAQPDFVVTPAVADICARLDGLPLAIELAAARVKLLAPEAMVGRLQRRLQLLVGGARDLPSRQQTLRATLDWSHDLLDPAEQRLFARLAVFAGGCTLEAAETVCDDGDLGVAVLDGLVSLFDKSLLRRQDGDITEPRLLLLETIREYAWERLLASGDADALAARHAAHFLALAEEAEPQLWRAGQERWFQQLDLEHDNLRAALTWSLARPDPEMAMRLAGALGAYWEARGQIVEAHRWLDAALAAGPASPLSRARALMAKSRLLLIIEEDAGRAQHVLEESLALFRQTDEARWIAVTVCHLAQAARRLGEHGRADALFEEGVELARGQGDPWVLALALNNRGDDLIEHLGDFARARPMLEESLSLRRALGEKRGLALTLLNLGALTLREGHIEQAVPLYEESLALAREVGLIPHTAWALAGLGLAAVYQGADNRALPKLRESLQLARDMRDRYTIAECLSALASVAAGRAELLRAARLWGAAERLHQLLGAAPPSTRSLHNDRLAAVREQLGAEAFQRALTEGRNMPTDQAIDDALAVNGLVPP